MRILNFGSCNIDFVYSLNHIVAEGETEQVDDMNIFPGGKGLNQSVALARAGANVFHAGCVGKDGAMLSELMAENGVDISYLKTVDERNGHAIIQVTAEGENSIFVYAGSNYAITEDFVDDVLDNFGKNDIIVLQNEINNVDLIVEKAYKKGMCVVFNPSPCNENIGKVNLQFVQYLILNEVEAEMLSGYSEAELSLKYLKNKYPDLKIVLTLGKKGSVFSYKLTEIFQPAFCAKTVDTTAAGDTFTGYFIAQTADGKKYSEALKTASAAAAIAVSRKGAAPSVPWKSEVKKAVGLMSEYKICDNSKDTKRKINEYVGKKLKKSSVKELAAMLGYSVTYTQSKIKNLYGKPLSKLVQDECCRTAASMLAETDLTISEIINNLGYENESFFRRIFKQKYGKTMSGYRQIRIIEHK